MIARRRVLLGAGGVLALAATGVALERVGRLDDLAGGIGIDPVAVPEADDTALLADVAAETAALLSAFGAVSSTAHEVLSAQLARFGTPERHLAPAAGDPVAVLTAAAEHRAEQSVSAVSPDLAVALAASSAGLAGLAAGWTS